MSWAEDEGIDSYDYDSSLEPEESEMQIKVSVLEAGKYPAIRDEFKRKYKVADVSAFEVGQTYDIEFIEESYTWEGQEKKSKRITKATPAKTAPAATPTNGNGKYTPEDKEAFAKKDLWMARMAALKASVEMAKAEAELLKNSMKAELGDIDISDVQKRYYTEFLAEITK